MTADTLGEARTHTQETHQGEIRVAAIQNLISRALAMSDIAAALDPLLPLMAEP